MMNWIEEQFTNWFTDDEGFRRVILIGLPTLAMASFLTVALNMCYVGTFNRASRGFGRRFVAAYQKSALQNLVRKEFDNQFRKFEDELEDRGMDIDNIQGDVDEFYDRFDDFEGRLKNIDERLENVEEGEEYLTDRMNSTEYEVRCIIDRDRARSLEDDQLSNVSEVQETASEGEIDYDDEDCNQWAPTERELIIYDYLNELFPDDSDDNWQFSIWLVENFSSLINFNNVDDIDFDYYWDVWRGSNQEDSDYDYDYDEIDENDVNGVTNHDSDVNDNEVNESLTNGDNEPREDYSPSNDFSYFNDMS